MPSKVSAIKLNAIMLGVRDVTRAKKFYTEGLGAAIEQSYPGFVKLSLGKDCSSLALYTSGTLPRRTRGLIQQRRFAPRPTPSTEVDTVSSVDDSRIQTP